MTRCLILVMLWVFPVYATDYYVRTDGNDSNAGTANTSGGAWLTLGKAASTVVAGDTVRVQSGVYAERVTESTSGTAGSPIVYVADGSVTNRGWVLSGNNVRVIGFNIFHPSNLGYSAFSVTGTNCQIIDNSIKYVSLHGIDYNGANGLVVRGNTFLWLGYPNGTFNYQSKVLEGNGSSTNVLVEYNNSSQVDDYNDAFGRRHIYRNNVLGPTTSAYNSGAGHVDGLQPNNGVSELFMEANWHTDNTVENAHLYLDERSDMSNIVLRANVSLRSGDRLVVQWGGADHHLAAHNTIGQVGYSAYYSYTPGDGGWDWAICNRDSSGSINNTSRNNCFTNATSNGVLYSISDGALTHDYDLSNVGGDITANPNFVDYANGDLRVQSSSSAKDAGGALTTVTSASGTGTSFTVADSYWFTDGFGLVRGDYIYVGGDNNLLIAAVDYSTHTITVSESFTWAIGESVGYAYRGSGPDIGAYEYGDTLLTAATITDGSTVTVTPTGDARMVVFYTNGVPLSPDYDSPYTYTKVGSETVTAKAYALRAQPTPVFSAVESSEGSSVSTMNVGTFNKR